MDKIISLIKQANSILILAHINPDGDALGSSLSLYNALLTKNIKPDIMIQDPPTKFNFLPNFDKIITTSQKTYDLVLIVDTASKDRIGQDKDYLISAKHTINIDHHKTNTKYANYNYISDNSPACCQYLYEIYNNIGIEINEDIAKCLMCGILTDTGGFQYADVNHKTFEIAAKLSKITDIPYIYKKALTTKTKTQFQLSNLATSRLEFYHNNKIVLTYLTQEELDKYNAKNGDHEGIVNIGREIEGIEVSIFIREQNDKYRISLRGNGNIDLSEVSHSFGGGGHKNAAGITMNKNIPFDELKTKLIETIKERLG